LGIGSTLRINKDIISRFFIAIHKNMKNEKTTPNIHIGSIIKAKVAERGFSEIELSKMINCHPSTIYNMYKREWMNTELLWKFSIALEYDFFTDIYGENMAKRFIKKDFGITTIVVSSDKVSVERNDGVALITEYKKITDK
jgi:lambda repressor-like predicted transcriptional regulator